MGRVYGDFEVLKVGTGALSEKLGNWVSGALGVCLERKLGGRGVSRDGVDLQGT